MDYSEFTQEFNNILKDVDLYKVLGVKKKATKKEITKAYHKKALKLHPDKLMSKKKEKELEEEMCILNAVYAVLSDPIKRRNYDGEYSADFTELSGPYKKIQQLEKDLISGKISKKEYNKKWKESMPKEHNAVYDPDSNFFTEKNGEYISKFNSDYSNGNSNGNSFSDKFNQIFTENKKADPNDIGYGDYGKELAPRTNLKMGTSYNSVVKKSGIKKPNNVFKKFDQDQFNYIFDQCKNEKETLFGSDELDSEVFGFEANDTSYSAPINSYNGLIIVGDDPDNFSKYQMIESSNKSLMYTDYSDAFDSHGNPDSVYFDEQKIDKYIKTRNKGMSALSKKDTLNKIEKYKNTSGNLKPIETEEEYFNRKRKKIKKEKKYSKEFVQHFSNQYPEFLVKSAFTGQLECSNEKSDTGLFYGN